MENNIILKLNGGAVWHFFYKHGSGLCYRTLAPEGWGQYEILLKESSKDFDAIYDDNNTIHIVCQSDIGAIMYLNCKNGEWRKSQLLESRTKEVYPKYFKLHCKGNWVSMFYVIKYNDKRMLVHHILEQMNNPPTVLDYVANTPAPFTVATDCSYHIYVTYVPDGEGLRSVSYSWSKKKWGIPKAIPDTPIKCSAPHHIIDTEDRIHLCYIGKTQRYQTLFYREINGDDWGNPRPVYPDCGVTAPALLYKDGKVFIYWVVENHIFAFSCAENGFTKTPLRDLADARHSKVCMFGVRCAQDSYKCDRVCGSCDNRGVSLCFITKEVFTSTRAARKEFKREGEEIEQFAGIAPAPSPDIRNSPELERLENKVNRLENELMRLSELRFDITTLKSDVDELKQRSSHEALDYATEVETIANPVEEKAANYNKALFDQWQPEGELKPEE